MAGALLTERRVRMHARSLTQMHACDHERRRAGVYHRAQDEHGSPCARMRCAQVRASTHSAVAPADTCMHACKGPSRSSEVRPSVGLGACGLAQALNGGRGRRGKKGEGLPHGASWRPTGGWWRLAGPPRRQGPSAGGFPLLPPAPPCPGPRRAPRTPSAHVHASTGVRQHHIPFPPPSLPLLKGSCEEHTHTVTAVHLDLYLHGLSACLHHGRVSTCGKQHAMRCDAEAEALRHGP